MDTVTVRELESQEEWHEAFPVVRQLRDHLSRMEYLDYLDRMTAKGHRTVGLYVGDALVSVAGLDILINMYYGRHVWVYDLVTDEDHRSEGYGRRLLEFVYDWAERKNCEKVALSSGLQRNDAHRFYEERVEMDRASYVFTRDLDES